MPNSWIVFTDLDGCLLDHQNYSYAAAVPVLRELKARSISVILCSSKTEAEMRPLAAELDVSPIITCENGGLISWENAGQRTVLGASRDDILVVLSELKCHFRFTSYQMMGIDGIVAATGLSSERAGLSAQRYCTEPLLWQDEEHKIPEFRQALEKNQLRLTKGGRFWHVSGQTNKGKAAAEVYKRMFGTNDTKPRSIGIGDSPIDQSLLDWSDTPIIIPSHTGEVRIDVASPHKIVASQPGPVGWAEAVLQAIHS